MASLRSKLAARNQLDYTPVHWNEYFHEALDIEIPSEILQETNKIDQPNSSCDSFRVYLKNFQTPFAPKREPGHSLDPTKLELTREEISQHEQVPTLVMLHGGGYSGLTWAKFVQSLEEHCKCRFMAIDLRGHGDTKTTYDNQMDMDTLVSDINQVVHAAHRHCGFNETPKIVLIGHSMGGAIAIKAAARCSETLESLTGFVVIDVVEGTAKDALPLMMSVIKTRPIKFPSLDNAIEWSVRSGMAKNLDAAKVSMPGNLVNLSSGCLAIHDVRTNRHYPRPKTHKFSISIDQLIGQPLPIAISRPVGLPLPSRVSALKGCSVPHIPMPTDMVSSKGDIIEESIDEEESSRASESQHIVKNEDVYKKPPIVDRSGFAWRTNLAKTQPHWNGWFDGLSAQMLAAPVQGKFLLLAGIDRLDKTLTIGQMQGKFMMKVLPKCGHAVHEDAPDQVASAIGDFLVRNKFAQATITELNH